VSFSSLPLLDPLEQSPGKKGHLLVIDKEGEYYKTYVFQPSNLSRHFDKPKEENDITVHSIITCSRWVDQFLHWDTGCISNDMVEGGEVI
jgi:hypothetical protein